MWMAGKSSGFCKLQQPKIAEAEVAEAGRVGFSFSKSSSTANPPLREEDLL